MKSKRLLWLALAAVPVYFAVKILVAAKDDIKRYNSLSAMSGDKTLLEDQMDKLKDLVGVGSRNEAG